MPQELEQLNDAGAWQDILRNVSCEVLETMFFADAQPVGCEHSWMNDALSARVAFNGSHVGFMVLAASHDAAASIAAAFLGSESGEMAEVEEGEVILELSNILCGALLSRLWPESSLLLEAPQLVNAELNAVGPLHCCFALEEGNLSISVQWSEPSERAQV